MQATVTAAAALDAFYSVIQTYVDLPPALVEQWRMKRTPRYSQVTEVLRRGFRLKPKGTKVLRQNAKEIYRLRDLAVHPSGKANPPVAHPDMDVEVEWRFAYFHAGNAELLVNAANAIIWQLTNKGKPTSQKIIRYANTLRQQLSELFPPNHPLVIQLENETRQQNKPSR